MSGKLFVQIVVLMVVFMAIVVGAKMGIKQICGTKAKPMCASCAQK